MKRILLITPFSPNNQGVGVSYSNQFISELSKDNIVDLIYFRYADDIPYTPSNGNINVLREIVIDLKKKLLSAIRRPFVFPLFSVRFSTSVCDWVNDLVKKTEYDILYFDFSQTFLYSKYINHPNKVLMSHDVIAQKYTRMKPYLRPWAMLTERRLLSTGTITFTFSEKDCLLLKKMYGIKSESTTFFLRRNVLDAMPSEESNYYIFFGAWDREENAEALLWFIDKVYGLLTSNFCFKIIGGGLQNSLKSRISRLKNFEYLGFVDDPYPIIANAKAEIAPLHKGAGVKVKCIEALASGTAIIGTEVAFEGISEEYNRFMLRANTPEEFAKYIESCEFCIKDKMNFKQFFIEHYNNKKVLQYIRS